MDVQNNNGEERKVLDLNGNPIDSSSTESPDQLDQPVPSQPPLSEAKGFIVLRVSSLSEAAGMLNAISRDKKGRKRQIVKWETVPQMNAVSSKMEIHMLIEIK